MSATTRIRYTVDALNRLVIREALSPTLPLGRKMAVNGSFRTGQGNALVYEVETKQPQGTESPLHRIELEGQWGLTPAHELTFTIRESKDRRATGETLVLRGALVAAETHTLAFSIQTRQHDGRTITRLLRLEGDWQVDGWNRLQFAVTQTRGRPNILTFRGAWQVGRQHELVYEIPLSGRQQTAQLRWQGAWTITDRYQLAYALGRGTGERLFFQAAIQSAEAGVRRRSSGGQLRYRVGIRVSRSRRIERAVTLFGTWRFRNQWALEFELPAADVRRPAMTVTFTKSFLQDAEWFLRLRRTATEQAVEGAVRIPF